MTIAEIHGKLIPYETLEDMLTSDVFGTFKYCDPQEGLVPFLEQAISFYGQRADLHFLKDVQSAEYFFWPRSQNGREPDVIIILRLHNGKSIAINIEAKYSSGKHNIDVDDGEEAVKPYFSGDQLVDQFLELKNLAYSDWNLRKGIKKALESSSERYLFYITSHYLLPRQDVEETILAAEHKNLGDDIKRFFWLNWRRAWKACHSEKVRRGANYLILSDLALLLERKRLTELALWGEVIEDLSHSGPFFWTEKKFFWQNIPSCREYRRGWFFWDARQK